MGGGNLQFATAIGAGAVASSSNTITLGRSTGAETVSVPGSLSIGNNANSFNALDVDGKGNFAGDITTFGKITVYELGTGGNVNLCHNAAIKTVATCSSSLRYKTAVDTFTGGLELVRQLRPITFRWKADGMKDVGFAAEEVNTIAPLLTTTNDKGEIEGVKYAQLTTILVNAVNQQQNQIEKQNAQIEAQQLLIDRLKQFVCQQNREAGFCKQE